MGKWSTILGIGKKVANHSATQTTARSIGGALVHPQRTLAGLGNATKTAVMYNPQIQISAESETKRSIFREKDKTKRSKKESAQHSKSRNKSFVMTSVSAL